jgi:tetratricopeptide (TPR) repeat protein
MFKNIVWIFVILFSLPVYAATKDNAKRVELNDSQALSVAHIMVNAGDLDKADALLNDILQSKDVNIRRGALFELGRIAMVQGDYSKAIKYFLTILKYYPDATSVRIELAKTYLLDGEYEAADFNLRLALADKSLPVEIQNQIKRMINVARYKKDWNLYAGFSIVPDSNLNYATGRREECINTIFGVLCRELEDKSTGVGIQYNLGGDYYIKITDKFGIKTSVSLYALDFPNSTFDDYMLYIAAGPRYIFDKLGEISIQPFTQLRWYGGKYYNTVPGVRTDINLDLTKRIHLSLGGAYSRDIYYNDSLDNVLRGNEYSTYIQPQYYMNNKSFTFVGLTYITNTAKLKSYGSDSIYYSIGYSGELPWTLSLYGRLDLLQTKYKDSQSFIMDDYTINKFARRDIGYRAYLRLSSRYLEYKRLYPAISYTYTKRNSNAPAYDFDKHRFQIEMNYRF